MTQTTPTTPPHDDDFPSAPPIDEVKLDLAPPLPVQWILMALIIFALPPTLVMTSVRLVMTEAFLQIEYNRPGFPEDPFGFTTEDRLEYGPYGVLYLSNNEPLSYLADLEIDGEPAFNERELKHMEDVQVVTQRAFQIWMITGGIAVFSMVLLARNRSSRKNLMLALRRGGQFTLALMVIGIIAVAAAWNFFFDTFHELLFEDGTWQFYRSDTLIRLYPEQFWFDASLTIGVLTIIGAIFCITFPWFWHRQHQADG